MEREVSKACPQEYCSGPGFVNIQYNSLLNLKFMRRKKFVASADDLILAIRVETVREAEKCSNLELSKMTLSKSNKISFNEEESRFILISRRKRKQSKGN